MGTLEQVWADARRAIVLTVELAASFGLSEQTLRADSALLPVAYYLFKRKPPHNWLSHPGFVEDRDTTRSWLICSLLKSSGIWGSGLDTLLTALRGVIRENHTQFPAEQLEQVMAATGKSLAFGPEESDLRPGPCTPCRAEGHCRRGPRSCERSRSRLSTFRPAATVDDKMRRARCRFGRPSSPPGAAGPPPGWKSGVSGEERTLPPETLLPGARQSQDVKCFALGHALKSRPHSPTSFSAREGPRPWIWVRSTPSTP